MRELKRLQKDSKEVFHDTEAETRRELRKLSTPACAADN